MTNKSYQSKANETTPPSRYHCYYSRDKVALCLLLCLSLSLLQDSHSFSTSFLLQNQQIRQQYFSHEREDSHKFLAGPLFSSKAPRRRKNKHKSAKGFGKSTVSPNDSTTSSSADTTSSSNMHVNIMNKIHQSQIDLNHLSHSAAIPLQHHLPQEELHHHQRQKPTHHAFSKILSNILPNNSNQESSNIQSSPIQSNSSSESSSSKTLVSSTPEWKKLEEHAKYIETTHLRDLMKDEKRCDELFATQDGLYLDYSRQRVTSETMGLLQELAEKQQLKKKINSMVTGDKINFTEDRAVLHTALRGKKEDEGTIIVDGVDVMKEVHEVLDDIKYFTNAVRSGTIRGYTGKRLRNIISVGIGGSYLGPEFLAECLKTDTEGVNSALGYTLRFLCNVDPVDVERACADLDPEETIIVIVSKTFTTAETMLNARAMRQWLWDFMGNDVEVVKKHVVAVSSISSIEKVKGFGIDTENYFFRFWDWVGGRYSVCSAVGGIPISLLYGYELFEKFLQGAHSIDDHFINTPFEKNLPVIMGLLGVWNMSFLEYRARTILPYAESLLKLPAHIQQLDMESNGKKATKSGEIVDYLVGEVDFGEPGTNGQHSFYQLLHMGQTLPCEFIGFVQSQHDLCIDGEPLSSHDELMANFFAQPDALANGKTADEVRAEGVPENLVVHKTFEGNRPSLSILSPKLTAYSTGQLLALYEHRTAVQGFLWDINSFDQWGVELGKKLANDVKDHLIDARSRGNEDSNDNAGNPTKPIEVKNSPATSRILNYYVDNSKQGSCEDLWDSNPFTTVARKTHTIPPTCHDLKGNAGKL